MQAIRIGTRASRLAIRQSELIRDLLQSTHPDVQIEIVTVQTLGDQIQDRPISALGDKAVFVRSLERGLLAGEIDLAVHSLKDVPADVEVAALELAAFSPREDPRDVLVCSSGRHLHDLPAGTRVGTSSLRRRAQLRAIRPDIVTLDIRGNVDTRIRKMENGEYDALILAAAGMHRLGMTQYITEYLTIEQFVPDAGQGIMVIQARADSEALGPARSVDHLASRRCALAERAVVRALHAGCSSPVGAHAMLHGDRMLIRGMLADEECRQVRRSTVEGPAVDHEMLGRLLARDLQRPGNFARL